MSEDEGPGPGEDEVKKPTGGGSSPEDDMRKRLEEAGGFEGDNESPTPEEEIPDVDAESDGPDTGSEDGGEQDGPAEQSTLDEDTLDALEGMAAMVDLKRRKGDEAGATLWEARIAALRSADPNNGLDVNMAAAMKARPAAETAAPSADAALDLDVGEEFPGTVDLRDDDTGEELVEAEEPGTAIVHPGSNTEEPGTAITHPPTEDELAFQAGLDNVRQSALENFLAENPDATPEKLKEYLRGKLDLYFSHLGQEPTPGEPLPTATHTQQNLAAIAELVSHDIIPIEASTRAGLRAISHTQPIPTGLARPMAELTNGVLRHKLDDPDFDANAFMTESLSNMRGHLEGSPQDHLEALQYIRGVMQAMNEGKGRDAVIYKPETPQAPGTEIVPGGAADIEPVDGEAGTDIVAQNEGGIDLEVGDGREDIEVAGVETDDVEGDPDDDIIDGEFTPVVEDPNVALSVAESERLRQLQSELEERIAAQDRQLAARQEAIDRQREEDRLNAEIDATIAAEEARLAREAAVQAEQARLAAEAAAAATPEAVPPPVVPGGPEVGGGGGEALPPVEAREALRYQGPSHGIFTERVDQMQMYNQLASRILSGTGRSQLTDTETVDVIQTMSSQLNRDVFVEVAANGKLVVFYEFDASNQDECFSFGETSESLVVQLLMDERADDFSREQLRVLRTFDTKSIVLLQDLEDPNSNPEGQFLVDYFDGEGQYPDPNTGLPRPEYVDSVTGMTHVYTDPATPPEVRTRMYEHYRENMASLLFQLSAYAKADQEGGLSDVTSIDAKVAKAMTDRLKTIKSRADQLNSDRNGVQIDVGYEVPMTVTEPRPLTGGPRSISSGESMWVPSSGKLSDVIKLEVKPMVDNIMKIAPEANAGRLNAANPNVSISVLVDQNKRLSPKEVAYLIRHNPHLDSALQSVLVGLQMEIVESDRLIQGSFGILNEDTNREDAEVTAIALEKAHFIAENGRVPEKHEEDQIEYAVLLASGLHKIYTGKYWDILAESIEGELMTGTDEDGNQVRTREGAQSGVSKKLQEITLVEDEMYDADTIGKIGIPAPRYLGLTKENSGEKPLHKWGKFDYERVADLFRAVRRGKVDNSEAVSLKRKYKFLGDVLKKQVGAFITGTSRTRQISSAIKQAERQVSAIEGLTPMQRHQEAIKLVSNIWGPQGAMLYIDKKLGGMMDLDPQFSNISRKIKTAEDTAILEARARGGTIKQKARLKARKTIEWFSTNDWEKPSIIEPVRKARDEARAKYFKAFMYEPLIDQNPGLVLTLQSRATSPRRRLVKDSMEDWLRTKLVADAIAANPDLDPEDVLVTEADFKVFELISQHQYRHRDEDGNIPPLTPDIVQAISSTMKTMPAANVELLVQRSNEFMAHMEWLVNTDREALLTAFASDHALGIGSYNAQLVGTGIKHGDFLSHYVGHDSMEGVTTRIDMKTKHRELFGDRKKLTTLDITDRESAVEAAKSVAKDLSELAEPLHANPDEQMRLKAELIIFVVSGLIDSGDGPSVFDATPDKVTILDQDSRQDMRAYFAMTLMHELKIPVDDIKVFGQVRGYNAKVNPVRQSDIMKALGDDLQSRALGLAVYGARSERS